MIAHGGATSDRVPALAFKKSRKSFHTVCYVGGYSVAAQKRRAASHQSRFATAFTAVSRIFERNSASSTSRATACVKSSVVGYN